MLTAGGGRPDGPRCAVLGSPIGHSLSPVLHRAAYAELGLGDWSYVAHEIDEPGLAPFLEAVRFADGWRGLSLTMPLKRVALELSDEVSLLARQVGAVNTIVFGADERRHGTNTDVPGTAAALREAGVERVGTAVLLGAGATAGSVLAALASMGLDRVTVLARNPDRAADLNELAVELEIVPTVRSIDPFPTELGSYDLAVSTVPAAAAAGVSSALAELAPVAFDVGYEPWPTPFAAAAQAAGAKVVSGLALLVHQAALQVELMTGRTLAPVDAMYAAGREALATRRDRVDHHQ